MKWIKKGRIFEPPANFNWVKSHAAVPIAYHIDGDIYRVYFSGRDDLGRAQTGYFEIDITNPRDILRKSEMPVLRAGELGTFDESGAMASCIVEHNGDLYLYYVGWNVGVTVPFRNALGLAISHDGGITFSRYKKGPIMDRYLYDPCFVTSNWVHMSEKRWRTWYTSGLRWEKDGDNLKHYYHLKYAESADGMQWDRKGTICIDFKDEREYAITRPFVLKENGIYKMWYTFRGPYYRIGYAESENGINWIRKDDEVGIDVSDSGWDSEMVGYAFLFDHAGERYMLYNGNGYGKSGIGLAVLERNGKNC